MSKPVPTDIKQPRLDIQQIQRGITLTTQLCHAASKEDLNSKEWTANKAAANELLRIFEGIQKKMVNAAGAMDSLIAAQIKTEVKMRMDKLDQRCQSPGTYPGLFSEIINYLKLSQSSSRESIVKAAIEKMRDVSLTADLGAKVTEAAEAALLEEFHKGIDKQMRGYMK